MEVIARNWQESFSTRDAFVTEVTRILTPVLEVRGVKRVELSDERQVTQYDHVPDTFSIALWSSPSNDGGYVEAPAYMWGYQASICLRRMYQFPDEGMVIIEPESGMTVARIIGNVLYVGFYIGDPCFRDGVHVFRKILQEAAQLLNSVPILEDLVRRRGTILRPVQETNLSTDRSAVRVAYDKVATLLQSKKVDYTKEADTLLESLYRIPEIERISVSRRGILHIVTETLYCRNPQTEKLHELGKFEMKLPFGTAGSLEWTNHPIKNITRRPEGYGHPHVDRREGWCMGEAQQIVGLARRCEVQAVVLMTLAAIQSVGDHHDGSYIRILETFPLAHRRGFLFWRRSPMQYPEKPMPSNKERKAFRIWFEELRRPSEENPQIALEHGKKVLAEAQEQLARNSRHVFVHELFARNLDDPSQVLVLAAEIAEKHLQTLHSHPAIASVAVSADILTVTTKEIVTRDHSSGDGFLLGTLTLSFDTRRGIVKCENSRPVLSRDKRLFHAPHVFGSDGYVDQEELAVVLPELLGGIDLEAAVSMTLSVLEDFDRTVVPAEVLEQWKKVA